MGRVTGFIALAALIGVASGLLLHRVVVGMLVGAGILLLGLFILIGRGDSPDPEL
ncbi:MAG TPA: hypothetical protein VGR44_03885 [Methylomirabilota bacterium]|nr:hypothetical protein [Methylomirabilota bacterium]